MTTATATIGRNTQAMEEAIAAARIAPLALGPEEAAAAIGVRRSTFYSLLASDAIKSFKCGKRRLIPVSELEAWVRRQVEQAG